MISDKLLYQFGNANQPCYVFFKNQFEGEQALGVKEQRADSSFIDGSVRLNRANKNMRTGSLVTYEFSNMFFAYSSNIITQIFYSEPKLMFWFEVEDFDPDNPELFRGVKKFYYSIADCTVPPTFTEDQLNNRAKPEQRYTTSFMLDKPYLYECTNEVEFIDTSIPQLISLWGTMRYGINVWGSTQAPALVSTLTQDQKDDIFLHVDPMNITKFLLLKDRFFRRDVTTARNYVYDRTVTANNTVTAQVTNAFRASPVDNRVYRIEISSVTTNGKIDILNLSNNTGLRITWVAPSPASDIVYNSYYDALYDSAGERIPDGNYTSEALNSDILYFTGQLNNRPFGSTAQESVRVINNTSTTTDVKIDALLAY